MDLLKSLYAHLKQIEVTTRSAAIAYYAMLSSVPLLAILITVGAQFLPQITIYGNGNAKASDLSVSELNHTLSTVLPTQASQILQQEVARIQSDPPIGLLSIGFFFALWAASNAFMALVKAMNDVYHVKETRPHWKVRLITLILPVMLSIVLIVVLTSIVTVPSIILFLHLSDSQQNLMHLTQWLLVGISAMLIFGIVFRFGPATGKRQQMFSPGVLLSTAAFVVASVWFQFYVANFGSYDHVYGSIGGFIILMVWLWMTSSCMLVGCALNKVLEDRKGVYSAFNEQREFEISQRR